MHCLGAGMEKWGGERAYRQTPHCENKDGGEQNHGKESVTHYEVLERFGHHSYLRCNLETGRTHQIRVHMSHVHAPIVGDPVYGIKKIIPVRELSQDLKDEVFGFPRQALHAIGLGLIHPATNEFMRGHRPTR